MVGVIAGANIDGGSMVQVVLTLALILFGLGTYFYGAYRLAQYGFRLSTGVGVAVLLCPPYTFYFAFKKLEVSGKELPTALVSFGLVLAIGLTVVFSYDLKMVFTGQLDDLLDEMDVQLLEERPEFEEFADRDRDRSGDDEAQAMADGIGDDESDDPVEDDEADGDAAEEDEEGAEGDDEDGPASEDDNDED